MFNARVYIFNNVNDNWVSSSGYFYKISFTALNKKINACCTMFESAKVIFWLAFEYAMKILHTKHRSSPSSYVTYTKLSSIIIMALFHRIN